MALNLDSTVSASPEQVSAELAADARGETVILQLQSGTYYQLDGVGARIWALILTPTTVRTVLDTLLAEYDVPAEQCEADLIALLESLVSARLVDVADGTPA